MCVYHIGRWIFLGLLLSTMHRGFGFLEDFALPLPGSHFCLAGLILDIVIRQVFFGCAWTIYRYSFYV